MTPAIALTLYKRPAITKRVLDALLECYDIDGIPVYLSQDWNFEHNDACEEVKRIAAHFMRHHAGPSQYFVHSDRLGIDLNKLFVIPKAFEHGADFVIFLEDDHLPSRDCVKWFIERGEEFKDDERIGFITGYARQTKEEFLASSPEQIVIQGVDDGLSGFCPSSWATWKDRWDYFIGDGDEYRIVCGEQGLFDHYMDLRHGERLYKHRDSITVGMNRPKWPGIVGPKIARVQLIGWEQATHTPSEAYWRENELSEWGMWSL